MKQFGLLGKNISYSFSKGYFTEKFKQLGLTDYRYDVFDLQDISQISTLFQQENLIGFNVTIPYKEHIINYLDELSNAAKEISAVNCVLLKNDKKIGFNTDVIGFKNSFVPLLESHHKKAIILGNGGASKAVAYVLNELKIPFLEVSRTGKFLFAELNDELINEHQIIINTTPVGTFPNVEYYPEIPTKNISKQHLVYDLIYNPERTKLLEISENQGAKIKNGLEMLYKQADAAWEIWNEYVFTKK
jgi:shikimate dehydrogenase